MTRLFLAAGVAALAISAPAVAKPDGGHGGGKGGQAAAVHGGGGGGGGGQNARSVERRGGGGFAVQRAERHGGGGFAVQRAERHGGGGFERMQQRSQRFAAFDRVGGEGKAHVERSNRIERAQSRGFERKQARAVERQQFRGHKAERFENRMVEGKQFRGNRGERIDNRFAVRDQLRGDRLVRMQNRESIGFGVGGCPPGLISKGCVPPGHGINAANRIANDAFRASQLAALTFDPRTRILDPFQATRFVGMPFSTVNGMVPLTAFPSSLSYLYPDTPDYYYRYGNGYLYEVDRDTSLISALLPLLGGGFLPGQYLPSSYMSSPYYGMNSFYPSAYGFNSFYPDYGNDCYRYGNGVVYEVDCFTGMVEDVIPMYAGGYGVGQLLPSSYGYYNVPTQYRSLYYNTPDYNYWYAPGAIYQYDPGSSMITSVAALLSPGFTIGQQLPMGYSAYNVPYAYRSTYYDTPNAWYRYNNGYIYQVDPMTQLVTAIVASILT